MKISLGKNHGSVLVMMVVVMALVGVTLGSYLQLVSNQNLSTMRSMAWNSAISVAEAGIEEAMAHLNANGTNRTADGWQAWDTNVVKERVIGASKYRVFISRFMDPPVIISEGYVRNPKDGTWLTKPRILMVGTTNDALFAKGMVAKGEIDLSGNNIKTDSFDSSDPNYSTGGRYDPAKAKDNGDVATNSSLLDSLDVWNADIFGRVSTGPGGTVRIGRNGSVGDAAWHAAGESGIQPGWASDDMNVQFPDVRQPFTGGAFTPATGAVDGTNYTHVLASGNYQLTQLNMSGQNKMLVTGNAVLLVNGDVSMSGSSYIYIAPGASLQLFVKGANTSIGGNGVLNANTSAGTFNYWGLPSNTSISMHGNASFTGTIYAPQAFLTLGGGGNDSYDFVGASVTGRVRMNGHFNFHYDESLRVWGPRRGYTVISWHETTWMELDSNPLLSSSQG